jgi:hypothetical protein
MVALHGVRVPTQRWVTHIALKVSGHERPYIRARWKAGLYDQPGAVPLTRKQNAASAPVVPDERNV